jgi:class 3 adenylate cyclase
MTEIGALRIATDDGIPFAREKLRACLVAADLNRIFIGQVIARISQELRGRTPAMIAVSIDRDRKAIVIQSDVSPVSEYRLSLRNEPDERAIVIMRNVIAFLTRDELMHDLERQVDARTAELKIERERSESLLRNMLPNSVATRIKDGETIADLHQASVVFIDIAGFTAYARDRNADEVVSVLDRIFRVFDEVTRRHGLEKIKTIGDGYLAAAGLPNPQIDHVDRAVLMALNIVAALPTLTAALGTNFDVRLGVHCGPVLAGVIGVDKPFYDIWGDTVNVAARLEKYGAEGKVHVSEDVRQRVGGRFDFEDRGMIELKNRGALRTWFVDWPKGEKQD